MSKLNRIHCHSAFQHYHMFHSNFNDSSYDNAQVNTTYNITMPSIWGNFSMGNVWAGVGFGIGASLMNTLMGWMNNSNRWFC